MYGSCVGWHDEGSGIIALMEEYVDEIILMAACVATSLLVADANLVIVGLLLSVALVSICSIATTPYRNVAQVTFLVCCTRSFSCVFLSAGLRVRHAA